MMVETKQQMLLAGWQLLVGDKIVVGNRWVEITKIECDGIYRVLFVQLENEPAFTIPADGVQADGGPTLFRTWPVDGPRE